MAKEIILIDTDTNQVEKLVDVQIQDFIVDITCEKR